MSNDLVARWRSLGLEAAFDPAELPKTLSARGRAQLRDDLVHLDAERLLQYYPRERDGRLQRVL